MSDLIDDLIEAARLLGATQAKKGIGCYTREDARFERAMHESISDKAKRLTAERDKAQRKYERQREATVNTYARVRRLIEALRVTGQHSNRWKLKYKSQVPSLKRTIRDLCAERDELRRQLAEAGLDARRYRWLQPRFFAADFAYSDPPVCAIVFRWPESAKISANLDREIDAAMGASNE